MFDRVDLREKQSAVRDQGMRATCLACAATAGHEYLRSDRHSLSVEYLHWTSVKCDGASKQGVSLKTTVQALVDNGQPYEELWPYRQNVDDTAADYEPPIAINSEKCFRVTCGKEIRPSVEDLKWHLKMSRAVVIGIRLFYGFHTSDDGHIQMPKAGESACGRHAVLLVGHDDHEQCFIFKNSWGETWGNAGYGFLPYQYISEHTLAAHVFSYEELRE
jgi:hypothetical protein